jgi:hypothetical protein
MYSESRKRPDLGLMSNDNSGCSNGCRGGCGCKKCCKIIGKTIVGVWCISGAVFMGLIGKALYASNGSLSDASISINMF